MTKAAKIVQRRIDTMASERGWWAVVGVGGCSGRGRRENREGRERKKGGGRGHTAREVICNV